MQQQRTINVIVAFIMSIKVSAAYNDLPLVIYFSYHKIHIWLLYIYTCDSTTAEYLFPEEF